MGTVRAPDHLRVSNLDFRSKMLQNDPGRGVLVTDILTYNWSIGQ